MDNHIFKLCGFDSHTLPPKYHLISIGYLFRNFGAEKSFYKFTTPLELNTVKIKCNAADHKWY